MSEQYTLTEEQITTLQDNMTIYDMTAIYRGVTYTATTMDGDEPEHFNAAWESIKDQLPTGGNGDYVDLNDGGCNGGSLRWESADCGGNFDWQYLPYDSEGRQI